MYIEEIRIRNYKNFIAEKAIFKKDINVLIGENDSGKTNFMSAIRLLMDKKLSWYEREIKEELFPVSLTKWKGNAIIISIVFNELRDSNEYESMFLYDIGVNEKKGSLNLFIIPNRVARNNIEKATTLSEKAELISKLSIDDYEMYFTGGTNIDYTIDENYYNLIGDIETGEYKLKADLDDSLMGHKITNIESIRNKLFNFTYIDALRDAVREMNQKNNPLISLIRNVEEEVSNEDRDNVKNKIDDLNNTLGEVEQIKQLNCDINRKINDSVGSLYSPHVDLRSDMSNNMKEVFRNLKLKNNIGNPMKILN